MKLERLTLENYRSHKALELTFEPSTPTYIVGPNAHGKTNILEAIYLLALTRSFRTAKQLDLIAWDEQYCRVQGVFGSGEQIGSLDAPAAAPPQAAARAGRRTTPTSDSALELEVFFGRPPQPAKSLKVNHVKTGAANFIGKCQMVFFHPEDLNMLYLGPDLRRRYLDILNIQVSSAYYRALQGYKKVMKQRNALLWNIRQGAASPENLDVWDEQLLQHGTALIEQRQKTVEFLSQSITSVYGEIAQKNEEVTIHYAASATAQEFAHRLRETRSRDLEAGCTTVGPHRDDLEFSLSNKPFSAHASRGEYRSLLLALKLLEVEFYTQKTGQKPLLLLDDVFSELDLERQKMLLQSIETHQVIITTTHLDDVLLARTHGGLKEKKIGAHSELRLLSS